MCQATYQSKRVLHLVLIIERNNVDIFMHFKNVSDRPCDSAPILRFTNNSMDGICDFGKEIAASNSLRFERGTSDDGNQHRE